MTSVDDALLQCSTGKLATFYHGKINRAETERRLKAFSKTNRIQDGGLYLLRKSNRMGDIYILSFMGYGSAMSHFIVTKTADNRLSLGGLFFSNFCQLVTYYSNPGANLLKNEWLLFPVPPKQTEVEPRDQLALQHQTIERLRQSREHIHEILVHSKTEIMKNSCVSLHDTVEGNYKVAEHDRFNSRPWSTLDRGFIV